MKCPLFLTGILARADVEETTRCDCLKEECAWWGKMTRAKGHIVYCCSLVGIAECLTLILEKMPHEKERLV